MNPKTARLRHCFWRSTVHMCYTRKTPNLASDGNVVLPALNLLNITCTLKISQVSPVSFVRIHSESSQEARTLRGFWALTDDDEAEDNDVDPPEVASPTPSDLIYESIQIGYSEDQVANCIDNVVSRNDCAWDGLGDEGDDRVEVLRRVVQRRTSASAVRPWKGPIPKVRLPSLTLADFIDTWKKVPIRRKHGGRQ
ncbi:hypothetical protein D1007_28516 [Hordeum vulgare]|nr:hypothetical protein D1007_28516 [Hordeum vulgare]